MEEVILSPEELYYLAKACEGSYLNYDFIEMLPDIQQNFELYEDNCAESLAAKGLVEEFWGDISVKPETKSFLQPIWDGHYEATASMVYLGEVCTAATVYIYGLGERCLMVSPMGDGVHIVEATELQLAQLIVSLMPEQYEKRSIPENLILPYKEATEMVVLKNVVSEDESAVIESFDLVDGWLCRRDEETENGFQIIPADVFESIALSVLKGE